MFKDCRGLTSITSLSTTAPQLGDSVFNGVNDSIPVYIPCGSLHHIVPLGLISLIL